MLARRGKSSAPQLRYKLRAGDHLIYREVFEREGKSADQTFRTRAEFRNDVVVLDEAGGTVLVGIQRNRQSAEMLEFREHGKDKLAQEAAGFQARMAKRSPTVFRCQRFLCDRHAASSVDDGAGSHQQVAVRNS